jgi:isopenicillin-N epimerase
MHNSLRKYYQLDPNVTFLNHGSFGATPIPVFERYQHWQRELERQPVAHFRKIYGLLREARVSLGRFLGSQPDNLGFVFNTTIGINAIVKSLARTLPLREGDEVLTTDHEYGAVDRTWEYYAKRTPFRYIRQAITTPLTTAQRIVDDLWAGVTDRTRVISLSHITSATATMFPVADVVKRARARGILTVIDGAHAPGHIPLNLDALGADFYVGNNHKWLSAPKGSAFVHATPQAQQLIEPLGISWGWFEDKRAQHPLAEYLEMQGTRDHAAFLATPDAIAFQEQHDWSSVRDRCHALVREARARVSEISGEPPIQPDGRDWFVQLSVLPLPASTDVAALKQQLYDKYLIEIPCIEWRGRKFTRISIQGYNDAGDVARLCDALVALLPGTQKL